MAVRNVPLKGYHMKGIRTRWKCIETGRRYASAKELARSLHYSDHYVSERRRKEGPLLEIDGQHYLLMELNYRAAHSQAVRCVENGKKFKSIADASRWANVHCTAIRRCLSGELKTAGGYHWRKVNE